MVGVKAPTLGFGQLNPRSAPLLLKMGTSLAGTLDHSQEPRCGRWRSGLRHEHIRAVVIATDIKWERGSLVTVTLRISSFTARSWGDGVARHGSRISRMPLAPWVSS